MRCSGWGTESRPGIPRPTQALVVRSKAQRGVHQDTPDLPLDWENGYIESFNARLREAKILIEAWRRQYNTVRPHSSLGYRLPAPEVVVWPAPPAALKGAAPATTKPIQPPCN